MAHLTAMSSEEARPFQPRFEVERLVLELAGLVRREEVLTLNGAGDVELKEHRLQIERTRWRLANAVRRRARAEGPAAA